MEDASSSSSQERETSKQGDNNRLSPTAAAAARQEEEVLNNNPNDNVTATSKHQPKSKTTTEKPLISTPNDQFMYYANPNPPVPKTIMDGPLADNATCVSSVTMPLDLMKYPVNMNNSEFASQDNDDDGVTASLHDIVTNNAGATKPPPPPTTTTTAAAAAQPTLMDLEALLQEKGILLAGIVANNHDPDNNNSYNNETGKQTRQFATAEKNANFDQLLMQQKGLVREVKESETTNTINSDKTQRQNREQPLATAEKNAHFDQFLLEHKGLLRESDHNTTLAANKNAAETTKLKKNHKRPDSTPDESMLLEPKGLLRMSNDTITPAETMVQLNNNNHSNHPHMAERAAREQEQLLEEKGILRLSENQDFSSGKTSSDRPPMMADAAAQEQQQPLHEKGLLQVVPSQDGPPVPRNRAEQRVVADEGMLQAKGLVKETTISNPSTTSFQNEVLLSRKRAEERVVAEEGMLGAKGLVTETAIINPSNNNVSSTISFQNGPLLPRNRAERRVMEEEGMLEAKGLVTDTTFTHQNNNASALPLPAHKEMFLANNGTTDKTRSPSPNPASIGSETPTTTRQTTINTDSKQDEALMRAQQAEAPQQEGPPAIGDNVVGIPGAHVVEGHQVPVGRPQPTLEDFQTQAANPMNCSAQEQDVGGNLVEAMPVGDEEEGDMAIANPFEPSQQKEVWPNKRILLCIIISFVAVGGILLGAICGSGNCESQTSTTSGSTQQGIPDTVTALSEREEMLQVWLEDSFGTEYFNTSATQNLLARKKALQWIANEDPLKLDPTNSTHFLQRYVLALFYFMTTQTAPWRVCNPPTNERQPDFCEYASIQYNDLSGEMASRWLIGSHECTWAGIACSTFSVVGSSIHDKDIQQQGEDIRMVEKIQLQSHGLNGNIPSEISVLFMLESFDVYNNSLKGMLHELSFPALSNLARIDLRFNQLSGTLPERWFLMPSLDFIRLQGNLLDGQIPSAVGSFNGSHLDLATNMLTGSLPLELVGAYNLQTIFMMDNYFTGVLPTEVGLLSNLSWVWVDNNMLSSALPSELGQLKRLVQLSLDNNLFNGTLPEEMYHLTELQRATFSYNNFTGTISTSIGMLRKAYVFDVSYNQHLYGSIPGTISDMKSLREMFFQGTSLSGSIPESFCSTQYQETLHMAIELVADCLPNRTSGISSVSCARHCCTKCCDRETGFCQDM